MLKVIAILFFVGENKAQIVDILAKNSANKSKLQKLQDKYKKKHDMVLIAVSLISFPSLLIALHLLCRRFLWYLNNFKHWKTWNFKNFIATLYITKLRLLFYSCELDHFFALSRDLQ